MADSEAQRLLHPVEMYGSDATDSSGDEMTPSNDDAVWKAWVFLLMAIFLEVLGTMFMKLSDGFANLTPTILIYVCYAASFAAFPIALKSIELGTAYAIWSGLGTCATVVIGFVWFKDTLNWIKIVSLVAIIGGCVAIKYADGIEEAAKDDDVER